MELIKEARELLARATNAAKQPMLVGRITRCTIGNFDAIAPADSAPVAYVADRADAALFARAPQLIQELCDEVDRLNSNKS